jgi:hypothetical protein
MQEALDAAVSAALEHKRRLGHYAAFWEGDRVVMRGEDAPADDQATVLVAAEPAPPWGPAKAAEGS